MRVRYAITFERGSARHSLRQRAEAAGLEIKADEPGMLVLADAQTPVTVASGRAAIGHVFDRECQPVPDLSSAFPADDFGSRSGCWGNFALFGTERDGPSVYRDPSGSIPVYQLCSSTSDIFVSDAEIAHSLGLVQQAQIDVSFALHWLQFPFLRTERTGICGARELLPGCIRRRSRGSWFDELGWKPWAHARCQERRQTFDQLAAKLRLRSLASVAAQVRGAKPLLQLSGGLDSSIIAASLAHAGVAFESVNFASRSLDGDERGHARSVAVRFGSPLFEIVEDELENSISEPAERKFRPGSNPILLPLDKRIDQHRSEIGADLLLDGGGGDNLFCFLTGSSPFLDAFRSAGLSQALQTCGDIAERADCTFWDVASNALKRALPGGWWRWKEDRRYLRRDILLLKPDFHPWLDAPAFSFPGKREHVASLVHIHHFLDRRADSKAALLHPLMSQPLLELCLAIPSWEWTRGGIDRAVARLAFEDLLPQSVIERRSKGSLQGLFQRSFTKQVNDFRDLLLSGRLVETGIVDRLAIEQAFVRDDWRNDDVQMRLSEMAALELWFQSWNS